jgi:hypothetical protein
MGRAVQGLGESSPPLSRDLLDVVKRSDWERKKLEYIDRGLFTLSDGYDTEKMVGLRYLFRPSSLPRTALAGTI